MELGKYSTELEKAKASLACKDQQGCIVMMESMNPLALAFSGRASNRTTIVERGRQCSIGGVVVFYHSICLHENHGPFSEHESEKAIKDCAGKVLKTEILEAVRSAQNKKIFQAGEIPCSLFVTIWNNWAFRVKILVSRSQSVRHVKSILVGLPRDLANDALRIAVRGSKEKREISAHYLLPEASQAAIDEVYLFAKRIKFDDELLEKSASETAKAQGKEIEKAVSTE